MKKIIFSFAIVIIQLACKTTTPLVADVTYKSYNNQIMNVESIGYGAKTAEAIENAKKNAIDVILFRGIPNSNLNKPLAGTGEHTIKQKNRSYFDDFYKNRLIKFLF